VLIVEDEVPLSRALQRGLTQRGCDAEVANDGAQATAMIMSNEYDVILSDIHVPNASGVDILRTIRTYSLDVPVILMTGDPSLETAIEAVDLGAMKYFVKPVPHEELVKAVVRATALHRMAKLKRDALKLTGANAERPGDLAGLSARFESALNTLSVVFQPIIDVQSGDVYGYEALMRTREPSLPTPEELLSAAERLDGVLRLGQRVREQVAACFPRMPKSHNAAIFINLHARELLDASLYDSKSPLMPYASRIVLEVTERNTIGTIHDVKARTSVLRFHGYRLAIDDLGAGYAGLTSFVTLEPEIVKLDMSLIRGIHESPIKQRLVSSVTDLCNKMDIRVVAEGVETREEMDSIRRLGCDLAQGFFLGRPSALFG